MTADEKARLLAGVARGLSDVARAFESAEGPEERIRYAMEVLGGLVPYDRCALLQRTGAPLDGLRLLGAPAGEDPMLPEVLESILTLLGESDLPSPLPRGLAAQLPWRSHLAVPLIGLDRVIGLVFAGRREPDFYQADHVALLSTFAGQCGAYLTQISLRAEVDEADRRKDRFLAVLAHELRNPLGPIRSAAAVIGRHTGELPAIERPSRIIERQVAQLARLLDDLLDVARIAQDRIGLRRELLDLRAVVDEAIESSRALVESRRQALSLSVPGEPVVVDADRARLLQIVENLLTNASKYTPVGGRIEVTLGRERVEAVLTVADDGIGMSPEVLSRVFELFSQADSSLSRSQGGLGIGLALVRRLVEMHGGSVAAESEGEEKGSRLTVRLPIADGTVDDPAEAETAPSGPCLRVLLVEDNPDSRDALQAVLEIAGHRVEVAENGPRGIERGLAAAPEVALIDVGLPGLDGYEVARRLRAALGDGVRLVAISGYGQPADVNHGREAGFDDYLVKPVPPDELIRALRRGRSTAA